MCKFIKELAEERSQIYYDMPEFYRLFTPIEVNENIWLSIQANGSCHCKPQTFCADLNDYTHWEVALFDKTNHDFVSITDVLPEFSSLAEIKFYENEIYSFVPTDLVEELYIALKAC